MANPMPRSIEENLNVLRVAKHISAVMTTIENALNKKHNMVATVGGSVDI
jgi:hypothetical protein